MAVLRHADENLYLTCIVADESQLRAHGRPEDGHVVDLSRFDGSSPVAGVPLVLGDTSLRIGVLTGLTQGNPGDWPGTEGRFVVALAQLADSPLARAAFEAMRAGILDGVCGMFKGRLEDDRAIYEQLVGIIALPQRDVACASARILETFHLPE